MTIEEKSLIADFLGWEKRKSTTYYVPNLYPHTPTVDHEDSTGDMEWEISTIDFDTRMDYMMPVLEKIEKQVDEIRMWMGKTKECAIIINEWHSCSAEGETLLEAVGQAVIQYIRWFSSWFNSQR